MVKAIIAVSEYGVLILNTDSSVFDYEVSFDPIVGNVFINNDELIKLEKEPYGLYRCECEVSQNDEGICLKSYRSMLLTWEI